MMRARNASRAALLLLLPLWAQAGAAEDGSTRVDIEVVSVTASGRGGDARYDPRIPAKLKAHLERSNLAYNQYVFEGRQQRTVDFGRKETFPLPDAETLVLTPSAYASRTHPVRLDVQILDKDKKPIMSSQLRVRYGSIFLLHRPKGDAALIIGISADRPPD